MGLHLFVGSQADCWMPKAVVNHRNWWRVSADLSSVAVPPTCIIPHPEQTWLRYLLAGRVALSSAWVSDSSQNYTAMIQQSMLPVTDRMGLRGPYPPRRLSVTR